MAAYSAMIATTAKPSPANTAATEFGWTIMQALIACRSAKLLFTLMPALAQFERDVLADRTKEGLAAARARGRKGGRKPIDSDAVRKAVKLYKTGQYTVSEITELTGVKKTTLYKNLHG